MIKTNNVEIPEAGSAIEYIQDTIGGWLYVVTRTTAVEMKRLDEIDVHLEEEEKKLAAQQQLVDGLREQSAMAARVATPETFLGDNATSTPIKL